MTDKICLIYFNNNIAKIWTINKCCRFFRVFRFGFFQSWIKFVCRVSIEVFKTVSFRGKEKFISQKIMRLEHNTFFSYRWISQLLTSLLVQNKWLFPNVFWIVKNLSSGFSDYQLFLFALRLYPNFAKLRIKNSKFGSLQD